jgi:hypothetical protein
MQHPVNRMRKSEMEAAARKGSRESEGHREWRTARGPRGGD